MFGNSNDFVLGFDDLVILSDSNINQKSFSNLGGAYELPHGLKY